KVVPFAHLMFLPTFVLIAVALTGIGLSHAGYLNGLLSAIVSVLWVWLIYRFVLAMCYAIFPMDSVTRFHFRFFAPLFGVFVVYVIVNLVTDVSMVTRVVVLNIFESPVTIGALLAATVGLYFYIDGVWGVSKITYQLSTRYTSVNPGLLEAGLTLGGYILIALGVFTMVNVIGLDSTTIAAITGGLSVGIGFGLREVLANFISGVLLLFEQSIRPADVMEIDGEMVIVDKLGIRSTQVRTLDNVDLVVPNELILTSTVKSYTRSNNNIRRMINVGVSYSSDVDDVTDALLKVAKNHPEVLEAPAPTVFFEDFGASSLDFQLAVWIDAVRVKPISSELRYMIWKEFAARNIEIPFPQRDLHIRSGLPAIASPTDDIS
ncbi:MAG: mechanosensitive ion channel, partial [Okeania sp. SIO3B3]|nr:mechanosensitive ion channel [Okeania sp. SIO3B3]